MPDPRHDVPWPCDDGLERLVRNRVAGVNRLVRRADNDGARGAAVATDDARGDGVRRRSWRAENRTPLRAVKTTLPSFGARQRERGLGDSGKARRPVALPPEHHVEVQIRRAHERRARIAHRLVRRHPEVLKAAKALSAMFPRIDAAGDSGNLADSHAAEKDLLVQVEILKKYAPAQTAALYTCPMHPEVTSDKPGSCPKCGMALVAKAAAH